MSLQVSNRLSIWNILNSDEYVMVPQGIAPGVRQALDLSRGWNMAADPLYRQYICELYNSGFDKQAEEVSIQNSILLTSNCLMYFLILILSVNCLNFRFALLRTHEKLMLTTCETCDTDYTVNVHFHVILMI